MRTMKDSHFIEQDDGDPATLALAHCRPQFLEQAFYIPPLNIGADRMQKDRLERSLMLALHLYMVPHRGTIYRTTDRDL